MGPNLSLRITASILVLCQLLVSTPVTIATLIPERDAQTPPSASVRSNVAPSGAVALSIPVPGAATHSAKNSVFPSASTEEPTKTSNHDVADRTDEDTFRCH